MGNVGDLAKRIPVRTGVRTIHDHQVKPGHEMADCLWFVPVLANPCGVDREAQFVGITRVSADFVSVNFESRLVQSNMSLGRTRGLSPSTTIRPEEPHRGT
jgi:hypothetical protein